MNDEQSKSDGQGDNPQGRLPTMEEPSETTRSVPSSKPLETEWVVGFVDGEGCFFVGINRHPEMTSGYQVLPEFTVVQHQHLAKLQKVDPLFGF